MKILYDYQAFEMQRIGGISRYFREILGGLSKLNGIEVELAIGYSDNEYLKNSEFSAKVISNPDTYENFCGGREFRGKWTLFNLRNKLFNTIESESSNKKLSIKALQAQDFDIFHATYYDDYFLPYLGEKPFVLTIYDMIHEIYPEYFNLADQTAIRKRRLAQEASKIIAISECTKRDLIEFCDISSEKVEVIHLSNSIESRLSLGAHLPSLPNRFLLFVGSRSAYKNFFFFVNSAGSILAADPTLHIVCTGSHFTKHERAFLALHNIEDRVLHFAASDAELELLYRRALAFVFPSLYEGFGLPVLEAFSNGCPAVLSNAGSLPEIGGGGAVYFEPKDVSSLRFALSQVLYGSEESRLDLVGRGTRRLQQFSWGRTCEQTSLVYREILETRSAI